jgi:glycosyltransferase involved in cell wall biosynthesis
LNTKSTSERKRLAIIPSDPIEAYQRKGIASWLEDYYNPLHFFDKVYLLSPLEEKERYEFGMNIIPTGPKQLKTRIRELNIDVIRAYGGYWACDMASHNKVSGVPVVVSVHDTNQKLLHNSIKRADIIFCMSEVVKKLVLGKVKDANKAWLLPNRVDLNIIHPYQEGKSGELNRHYPFKHGVLHVGRKSEQKNLDTLVRAIELLGNDYCLLAVGDGNVSPYLELARQEGVAERCFFIDSIRNNELARYYSWADCMCVPSRWEGFGIVFIEALACEAIVVTSDIAPMNEYIRHMENGLLVRDYESPRALADMIKLACEDGSLREHLKKNARKSVGRFEKGKIDELEVSYYKKILEMKREGYFSIPLWKQGALSAEYGLKKVCGSFFRILKKFVPRYVRRKIRSFLDGYDRESILSLLRLSLFLNSIRPFRRKGISL